MKLKTVGHGRLLLYDGGDQKSIIFKLGIFHSPLQNGHMYTLGDIISYK